jgi:phosphomannomutase
VISRRRRRTSLAPKEKDGFQVGVMALALAARLHRTGSSFAAHYLELLEEHAIVHRFYERRDVTLFDESLQGEARERARAEGNQRKQAAVDFFAGLERRQPAEVEAALRDRLPGTVLLPHIQRIFHAGDGTLIEMEGQWFELRASGTDAVLRYYMEGRDADQVSRLNEAFTKLDIPAADSRGGEGGEPGT